MKEITKIVSEKHLEILNKKERAKHNQFLKRLKEHRCYKCPFSTWTGTKLFCMVPRCIRSR